ncbi:tctex1 domain-containing protein 1-like [Bradysia coprophila]|uniref:tctex1 domain-containing protein 1-like n=1 Tax=Bradysia coprophila TaxID=38358 RepID=UPI00187DD292|nr:tctex1 domain-containing protein 1-like [Bradysia coprophila]
MATNRPGPRYQPTYCLEPKVPFDKFECERLMATVINEAMLGFQFEAEEAETMSEKLSKEILQKVKNLTYDRYKFVCVVTLGEKYMQGYCDIFKCLWDMSKDSFAIYLYDTATLFVSAVLFAVYFD